LRRTESEHVSGRVTSKLRNLVAVFGLGDL
jgi:hypothetical protein